MTDSAIRLTAPPAGVRTRVIGNRRVLSAAGLLVLVAASGCAAPVTPSPLPSVSIGPSPSASAEPSAEPLSPSPPSPTPAATPTRTPEPPLSLARPNVTDPRVVTVAVTPNIGADGGTLTVIVTSLSDERIDDLVLRWPTELAETLFLAPFTPSPDRIAEGGLPLVQVWTKWVIGPGERGEPAGTTSLGYGPLLARATLEIPIFVTRRAPRPVGFDLQVLADNDLLTLDGGAGAELRVEVP